MLFVGSLHCLIQKAVWRNILYMQLVSEIKDLILIIKLVNIPHMFILYFIRAILSKKYQSEWLKKVLKREGEIFHQNGVFRLNLARNIFTRELWSGRILFICFMTTVSHMLEPALFQNLFNDWIIWSLVPNLIPGKIGATLIKVKYPLSIYFKYTASILLKYIWSIYFKYTWKIHMYIWSIYFKYTSIYLKFTSSRLQVTILEPVELQKKKYYS